MDPIYILFGTESGNAEDLANRTKEKVDEKGYESNVVDMQDFDPKDLPNLKTLLIVTSTFGNGDPPYNAEALHAYLMKEAPELPELSFSVLALGDTTYDYFAQCGKDFDRRLGELKAHRFADRVDCDVDFDEPYEQWLNKVLEGLDELLGSANQPKVPPPTPSAPLRQVEHAVGTRKNPLSATVLVNRPLTGEGSTKHTRHVELSLEGSGIEFELGDSFGFWVHNDAALVEAVAEAAAVDLDATVSFKETTLSLREALTSRLDLVVVDPRLIAETGAEWDGKKSVPVGADGPLHHVVDVLRAYPKRWDAQGLVGCLRGLAPRLYSIASSAKKHPNRVCFMVGIVQYELHGSARWGVASHQVAQRLREGDRVRMYLHPTPSFRLTADDVPIIMIGPGTGLAPYRAFLQEREARGAKGKNWLFFGERNRKTDFFYQDELEAAKQSGLLTRLDLAFSRDQPDRIYVQHRMREQAKELYAWIEEGAVIYVCGDDSRMAPDVHRTLAEIIAEQGGKSLEAAGEQLAVMAAAKRYQKDVY